MIEYTRQLHLPKQYITRKVDEFLAEDAPDGDKTTMGTVDSSIISTAAIQAEEELIFAGEDLFDVFFGRDGFCRDGFVNEKSENLEKITKIEKFYGDGEKVPQGGIICKVTGLAAEILQKERILLNIIQRLCGISTMTAKYVEIAEPYNVKILDTRKTTPGLRLFEKYAVAVGGGHNHRLDLSSGILIKDNHISAAGGVANAIDRLKHKGFGLPVELEVDNFAQIEEGIKAGVDGFLLDNMSPAKTCEAVRLIRSYPNGDEYFIESSGGITLETLGEYVKTGIDAVSVGALTHSVMASEIHIEFE